MADSQTFLVIHDCIQNTSLAVEKGYYIVTAVTPDGETPMCPPVQNGWAPSDHPPIFPTPAMDCVNYYLTNTTATRSDFTWAAYPDALGYNVYSAPIADPTNFTLYRESIPLSVLEIADQAIIVTAITPFGETPKCAAIEFTSSCAELDEYLARVAANGGVEPPIEEQFAVCDFISGMKAAGLWDKMYTLSYFSNNGQKTAETWLKGGIFPDVWDWDNPLLPAPSLSVKGMRPYDFVVSSVPANSFGWTASNFGATVYCSEPITGCYGAQTYIYGSVVGARMLNGDLYNPPNGCIMFTPWIHTVSAIGGCYDPVFGFTWADVYKWDSGMAQPAFGTTPEQTTNSGCGYYSVNRTASNACAMYYAASNKAHGTLLSSVISGWDTPDGNTYLFSDPMQGNHFAGRVSFLAFHDALTASESETLYNLVTALRQALGGGYV